MIDRYRLTLVLGALGTLLGVLYAEFIGCETGCTMKSSPWIMAIYGAMIGGFLGSIIDDYRKKRRKS